MPAFYVVNTHPKSGQRTLHRSSCGHLPKKRNAVSLGFCLTTGRAAKAAAAQGYAPLHLCAHCCGSKPRRH